MRMIVAMLDKERRSEVTDLLRGRGVSGYSIIPSVFGKGETGVAERRSFQSDRA